MIEHKFDNPQIEQFETSGKFRLDGGEWDVDNNVYLLAEGTVDERVLKALESKANLARTLVDDYRTGLNPFQ